MSAKPQDATSGRGSTGEKVDFGDDESHPSIKTEEVGLLGRARVKQVLGKFVTFPSNGRG